MGRRVGSSLVEAGQRRGGVEDRLGRDEKTLEGHTVTTRWQLGQGCDVWPPKKGQKRGDWHAREGVLGSPRAQRRQGTGGGRGGSMEAAPHRPSPQESVCEGRGGAPAAWGFHVSALRKLRGRGRHLV